MLRQLINAVLRIDPCYNIRAYDVIMSIVQLLQNVSLHQYQIIHRTNIRYISPHKYWNCVYVPVGESGHLGPTIVCYYHDWSNLCAMKKYLIILSGPLEESEEEAGSSSGKKLKNG